MEYNNSLESSDEFTSNAHVFIALFLNAFELLCIRRPLVYPTHNSWIDVRVKISVLSDSASYYESTVPVYNSPTVYNHDNTFVEINDIFEHENLKKIVECDSSFDSSDEFTSNAHAFIALFLNAFELLSGRRPGVPTHITWIDVRVKISVLSDSANHYESSAPVYNSPTVHNHDNAGDQDNDILEDVNLKENVECDSSLES